MCILELIKVLIYESHHDKHKHDNKSKLLFRDNVSLMY